MKFFETCEGIIFNLDKIVRFGSYILSGEPSKFFSHLFTEEAEEFPFLKLSSFDIPENEWKTECSFLHRAAVDYILGTTGEGWVVPYLSLETYLLNSFKGRKEPQKKKKVSDF